METKAHLDNAWVAIHTRILYEKMVAEHLVIHGYECFLPLHYKRAYRAVQISKNDKHHLDTPLFPGYLFCRYKIKYDFPILQVPGVIKILGCNGIPAIIPDHEIESLQKIVISGLSAEAQPFLHSGQKIRVNSGPLCGVEGFLVKVVKKNLYKIAVGVSIVEKSLVVDIVNPDVYAI